MVPRRAALGALAASLLVASCVRERSAASAPATSRATPAPVEAAPASRGGAAYERGLASYYASSLAGHRTANGETYDPFALTAAHRKLPFGTRVEVRTASGRAVVVRINDRGPFVSGRVIDLSRRAAEELGIVHAGVAEVELRVVATPESARR
jgi:rare lipoprotein A